MISVAEAQNRIVEMMPRPTVERVGLAEAHTRILAEEVLSPFDLPSFHQSAMDGYALRAADTHAASEQTPSLLRVPDTMIAAGAVPSREVGMQEALRIFTGAPIPTGADAVVRQEEVTLRGRHIVVGRPLRNGENIRRRGEEVRMGDMLFRPGIRLTPAAIGVLATIGREEVSVFALPRVGILTTGSEIIAPTDTKTNGKIFDSNSPALAAALAELRIAPAFAATCPDDKDSLRRHLRAGLERADFLLVTGGVSVGDLDFVREMAAESGVGEVFWRVKQKPGKPLYFGHCPGHAGINDRFLFGLPGNPVSALVCFYEFVRPALLRFLGGDEIFLPRLQAALTVPLKKRAGLTHFMRGRIFATGQGNRVHLLPRQDSHMMTGFAQANCLIVLPEEREDWETGAEVECHLLPV
jgi:molybdopterin molybdotransferase